eukprot:m.77525 g.77525  ORF g.77525 m.77525 type:complete len:764 (+) comp36041_c0_seq1:54-2345(+)
MVFSFIYDHYGTFRDSDSDEYDPYDFLNDVWYGYDASDTDEYDSEDSDFIRMNEREKKRQIARDGRRQKAKDIQQTHAVQRQIAAVFQLSNDPGSYLSRLPHEMIFAILLSYCGFPDNDVRLAAKGFDKVGLRVRIGLPFSGKRRGGRHGTVVSGTVAGYDWKCDEHMVRLASGEDVQVQVDGIGRNGCHVEFGDASDDAVKIPSQLCEVTLDWIKEKFKQINVEINKMSLDKIIFPPLQGDTCQACKAKVSGKDEFGQNRQINCFIKFGLSSDDGRGIPVDKIWESGCHQREVYFYSFLYTMLSQFIAPECYYAHCDMECRQSVLLLQHLSESHSVGSHLGLTQPQLKQALLSLAVLHSSFWGTSGINELFADAGQGSVKHIATTPLHALTARLQAARSHLISALPSAKADFAFLFENVRFLYFHFATRPVTLTHSDVRPDHLFFPASARSPAVIVDWQRCQPGVAVRDVTTLLAAGCTSQKEDVHHRLITFYAKELNRSVVGRKYTASDAYADYQLYLLLHMLELAVFIDAVDAGSQRRRQDALKSLLRRVAGIVVAVRSFDLFREVVRREGGRRSDRMTRLAPRCYHQIAAVRRQMMYGLQKGKYFFGCPHFDFGEECTFFEWTTSTSEVQESGAPLCIVHREVASVRYSLKPATLGKAYYCCSADGEDQCRLFRWLEDGKDSNVAEADRATGGRVCRNWSQSGHCRFGARCYHVDSHTTINLPPRAKSTSADAVSQTKCRYWENGRSCPYGKCCRFAHV